LSVHNIWPACHAGSVVRAHHFLGVAVAGLQLGRESHEARERVELWSDFTTSIALNMTQIVTRLWLSGASSPYRRQFFSIKIIKVSWFFWKSKMIKYCACIKCLAKKINPIDFRKKIIIMTNIAWIVLIYSTSKSVSLTHEAIKVIS
jgi:hypothetical protein